jgi:hypothetical protein
MAFGIGGVGGGMKGCRGGRAEESWEWWEVVGICAGMSDDEGNKKRKRSEK